ncbi:TAXI family TRAP transporter solute-binding subunit [Rhodoplanes tepidamans]|uniref:TAXI family TRAP transporter solute-binding subunit n=1 Tax=Rhodoplanes tepidamans TaxID=200616 RepID=A0ABT5JD10_RHOTP|nr:TAXI family TRAP transporter solute-binding subunit [Rhodoplanes tepidamans]
MHRVFGLVLAAWVSVLVALPAAGQGSRQPPAAAVPTAATPRRSGGAATQVWHFPDRDKVNEGTVTIMTGPVGGLTPIMGSDLARVLDDGEALRVLPVAGKGSVQNIIDMLFLKSVDMGFVASDVVEFFRLQYNVPDISHRLRYIAKLYNNEIHIIAPTSIRSVFDLAGKTIMAPKDLGLFSTRIILSRLGIDATIDYATDDTLALQKVIDGKADAFIVSVGKVFPIARGIENASRRLHLVSIPYDKRLWDLYMPSTFSSDEYPNLVAPGEIVETLATSNILASFNWPENTDRYRKVARFTEAFFAKSGEFYRPPRNPKWKEMAIGADVKGWTRFKAAQDWLDRNGVNARTRPAALPAGENPATAEQFEAFLRRRQSGNHSPEDVQRLFREFTEWSRSRGR